MAELRNLWIIVTTSMQQDADTDDGFALDLRVSPFPAPNGTSVRIPFPDLPSSDERERGATDQYLFKPRHSSPINMDFVDGDDISITILGDDAWLPSSIWAIGEDANGTRRLIAGEPDWPTSVSRGWFSTDPAEGRATRSLQF